MLELQLTPEDNALIIGSDGLWDVRQQDQTRRLVAAELATCGSGRPPACARAALWALEQSCGRLGCVVQPWSLSEAPPKALISLAPGHPGA